MIAAKNERSRAWCAACLCSILALLCLSAYAPAQQTNEFIYMARNSSLVSAQGVTTGPDGRVYMADGYGGVRVYCCNQTTMTCAAQAFDGGAPQQIAVSRNGTIFVATGNDGVRAYRCGDSTLNCIAHVRDGEWALDIAISSDDMVYVAYWDEGLYAYRCTERGLVRAGQIDCVTGAGPARGVAVAPDGTVILSVDADGLYAYRHEGDAFIQIAHTPVGEDLYRVAVSESGLVYSANGLNGLQVYRIENGEFVHVAMADDDVRVYDVAIGSDGTVYTAGENGLCAFQYEHRMLQLVGHAGEGMTARGVCVHPDNTVLIACDNDGLYRYTRLGSEFVCVSHIDESIPYPGEAVASCQADDGTVFLANGEDGIYAYDYTGSAFRETVHRADCGDAKNIAVGPDNLLYVGNQEHQLLIYSYTGTALELLATIDLSIEHGGNAFDIEAPDRGLAYVSTSGGALLRIARMTDMSFAVTSVYSTPYANGVAVGPDGTIFLARGNDGLFAYRATGTDLEFIAQLETGEWVHAVTVGPDGTVFALQNGNAIGAYRFMDDALVPAGFINDVVTGYIPGFSEIGAGPDGTVFAAGDLGVYAYRYTEGIFTREKELALPGNGIEVGRNGTLFLSNLGQGLFAYRYTSRYMRVPQIAVHPTEIDFGDVLIDQARPLSVSIRNSGTAPLEFYVQKVVGEDARDFRFSATVPDDIPMNAEIDLEIVCYPLSGGVKSAVMQIGTNDPVAPLIEIPMSAYAVVGPIEVIPLPPLSDDLPAQAVLPAGNATLSPNYPNPFNPSTMIAFEIPRSGHVRLEVFDPVGRRIAVLVDDPLPAGVHRVRFEAADLPSGIYTGRLHWNGTVRMQRMMLVK